MRRKLLWSAGLLLVLVPALAALDDKKPPDSSGTPKERYDALLKEYTKAMAELQKAFGGAKTDEERTQIREKAQKLAPTYAGQFLDIAEKNAKDPVALDALLWIVRSVQSGKEQERAITLLNESHAVDPKLATVFPSLGRSSSPEVERLLRASIEKNTDKDVQGKASFALAKNLLAQAQKARRDKKGDAAKLSKQAEETLERVIKDFGDVKDVRGTLGQAAKSELDELRSNLAVGKTAPEIEGEDIDGKTFKLSDYRGKVVLLDFWGHW